MIIMKESYFGINLRVLKERPDNKKDDWKTNSNHPYSDTTFNIVLEFASPPLLRKISARHIAEVVLGGHRFAVSSGGMDYDEVAPTGFV